MKSTILFLMFGLLFLLFACQNDIKPLDIPTRFEIVEDIITFDEVEGAHRYRIETIHIATQQTKRFIVTLHQNIQTLYLAPGDYQISIQALSNQKNRTDSPLSIPISYTQIDPFLVSTISKDFLTDPLSIRFLGRHFYNPVLQATYFYFTASGFEVTFFGTSLEAELITGVNPLGKEPHLVVFLNGETDPTKATLLVLDQSKKTYVLAENLEEKIHTVRVLKRSESIDSLTGITSISTDGHFLQTNPLKSRKIEVIAASSSAGFGNLALNSSESKTTQNSDGLRAYAYLSARMLDAEINIFSASGWPLLKGPWTGQNNIPTAYEFVNVYSDNAWDHTSYHPDVIIINLGTNDWSYIQTLVVSERASALINFENAFVSFLSRLHQLHPQAILVVAYGLMNESHIYPSTLNVVTKASEHLTSAQIYYIQLPSVNASDGIGSSNHPSLKTHIKAAQSLADALSEWLDWDLIRPNITE